MSSKKKKEHLHFASAASWHQVCIIGAGKMSRQLTEEAIRAPLIRGPWRVFSGPLQALEIGLPTLQEHKGGWESGLFGLRKFTRHF